MSQEAINFRKENINLNYRNMSLAELNKLPPHNGVIEFKITKTSLSRVQIPSPAPKTAVFSLSNF